MPKDCLTAETYNEPFFNYRIISGIPLACHPERSRSFSERRAKKNRGANATKGSLNEFEWLLNRCNIPIESHRELLRDPASANASRFRLAPRSTEVRLRSG